MQLDPDEIRTFKQDSFFQERNSNDVNPLTIFFAVLAAILVAWLIRAAYVDWQVRRTVEMFNQEVAVMNAQTQNSLREMQKRAQAAQEVVYEQQRAEADKVRLQKLQAHQLELDRQAALSNAVDVRQKKEQAWQNYYKPSKDCEPSNGNKDLVKCGNEYARAKKNFEEYWAITQ